MSERLPDSCSFERLSEFQKEADDLSVETGKPHGVFIEPIKDPDQPLGFKEVKYTPIDLSAVVIEPIKIVVFHRCAKQAVQT